MKATGSPKRRPTSAGTPSRPSRSQSGLEPRAPHVHEAVRIEAHIPTAGYAVDPTALDRAAPIAVVPLDHLVDLALGIEAQPAEFGENVPAIHAPTGSRARGNTHRANVPEIHRAPLMRMAVSTAYLAWRDSSYAG